MTPVTDDLDRLADFLGDARTRSAVVIVDTVVESNGYGERVRAALLRDVVVSTHVVEPGEPSAAAVDLAADAVRAAGRGAAVVAVGGGSVLDVAKLASSVATAGDPVGVYALGARRLPARHVLVAIPTTSGTGSEATRTCIFSDSANRKVWAWGDELLPDLVVLDPQATVTLPATITAATGLDAFVHAVEAASGQRRDAESVKAASQAIALVLTSLPAAVRDGTDLDARAAMQRAAHLAGNAIDRSGTGVAHAIGHALGTLAHVPHGAAVAVGLDAALAWNVDAAHDRYVTVADVAGVPVAGLAERYETLLADVAFDNVATAIGTIGSDAGRIAATMGAEENLPMLDNNASPPAPVDRHHLAERTLQRWTTWCEHGGRR